MLKTKYPKSATQSLGYVIITPDGYDTTKKYPVVIVGHGAGEVGDGSDAGLQKVIDWSGWLELHNAVDLFQIVVIHIQTSSRYQFGEIQNGILVAKGLPTTDPNYIHYYGVSLGGYGFAQQAGNQADLAAQFATIKLDMMGSGAVPLTGDNIAIAKTPTWLSHAKDDNIAPYSGSDELYKDIVANNGVAWFTQYITGKHLIASRTLTAYNMAPNKWLPASPAGNYAATGFNAPKMSWYEWIKANKRGQSVIAPDSVVTAPTPIPPPKKLVATIKVYDNGDIEKVV